MLLCLYTIDNTAQHSRGPYRTGCSHSNERPANTMQLKNLPPQQLPCSLLENRPLLSTTTRSTLQSSSSRQDKDNSKHAAERCK